MSLQGIVLFQDDVNLWLVFMMPLAFLIYFISVSAELNRTPTDIAEAESEIVAGYLTEYSGMKWGLFYGMDIGYAWPRRPSPPPSSSAVGRCGGWRNGSPRG